MYDAKMMTLNLVLKQKWTKEGNIGPHTSYAGNKWAQYNIYSKIRLSLPALEVTGGVINCSVLSFQDT